MAALAACSLEVESPQSTLWEGQLQPTGPESSLSGSAAAVSRESSVQVGVEVTGGEAGDRWIWRFREGTCDSPGGTLGSAEQYPVLEAQDVSDPGAPDAPQGAAASEQVVLGTTLDTGQSYHAIVAAEDAPETLLACGDLSLQ